MYMSISEGFMVSVSNNSMYSAAEVPPLSGKEALSISNAELLLPPLGRGELPVPHVAVAWVDSPDVELIELAVESESP